jgi:hypothetical protein
MSAVRSFRSTPFGAPGVMPQSLGIPTAAYPGRIATNSDLIVAVDRQQTFLALTMQTADISMTVVDPSLIGAYSLLSIENEIVKTTGPPVGNVFPVSRGFDGTTPAIHISGAAVSGLVDAYHHNALVAEIEAIEQTLGPNLANLPTSAITGTAAFNFPAQQPGGSLTVGLNVITLTPVPRGVNGSDAKHYLYISNGTGAAEAVLIGGGTAVAGNPSGTVIVTCANTHSGPWQIGSASTGIQEAAIAAGPSAMVQAPPGATCHVYAPVTFMDGQFFVAWGAVIERDFSTAGNVLNFINSSPWGGLAGGQYTVGGGFTEPANSYKVYVLGSTYFQINGVQFSGGWGNIFCDQVTRGSLSNIGADAFSGDCIRLGSAANGPTGVTIVNVTTSDETGTGTAIHCKYGLMELSTFDFQGGQSLGNSSKGIYIDPDGSNYFDESQISCGVIDSMAGGGIVVNPAVTRFAGVSIDNVYMSGVPGINGDFPCVTQNFSFTNSFIGGNSGSGAVFFRAGSSVPQGIALHNIRSFSQLLSSGQPSRGIGFLGGAANVLITDCMLGVMPDGTLNPNSGSGLFFAAGPYTDVAIRGGVMRGTDPSGGIVIRSPTTGITVEGVNGVNPGGPSAITVGASPFTYTAGSSGETVYITGGTVSSVTHGGITLAASTGVPINVPANGSIVVTYSAAPTMVRDIH